MYHHIKFNRTQSIESIVNLSPIKILTGIINSLKVQNQSLWFVKWSVALESAIHAFSSSTLSASEINTLSHRNSSFPSYTDDVNFKIRPNYKIEKSSCDSSFFDDLSL